MNRRPQARSFEGLRRNAGPLNKPDLVKTLLRDMIIVPGMIESIVSVYNGETCNQSDIKPETVGKYLGEFFIMYKPVKHGIPGIGSTHSLRLFPFK